MNYQLGLIGYPIQHSLSPWIHGQFFEKSGLKGSYSIIEIEPEAFEKEMESLKNSQINGFNVTVPYKEKIIPFLDEIDDQAKHIGAVNTVRCKNGKWIGYNTDGAGYVRSLQSKYPELKTNKAINILILGAGGAAKGIYFGLVDAGYRHITIANRTIDKAAQIFANDRSDVTKKLLTIDEAEKNVGNYDCIIQTTSVGMKPHVGQSVISLNGIKQTAIVSDIVYQPLYTAFLNEAKSLKGNIHLGHTMLLYQAQLAFEIWTGSHPEIGKMDEALQDILEGN